jgi:hypothetical protein
MTIVLGFKGEEIAIDNCKCGAEPDYVSATGVVHIIKCRKCGRQTDLQMVGMDAVCEWNAGNIFADAAHAPLAGRYKSQEGKS